MAERRLREGDAANSASSAGWSDVMVMMIMMMVIMIKMVIMMIKMTMRMVTIMLMLTTRWMLVLGLTCSVVVTLGLVVVTATLRRNTRFIIIVIVLGILSNIIKQARTRDNLPGLANTDQRAKNPDQTTSPWPSPKTRRDSG